MFISWSGPTSLIVGAAVKDFIDYVFAGRVETFLSDQDIPPGERFIDVIAHGLEEADLGILLLTPTNMRNPWLLFEAGALASRSFRGSAIPILLGVDRSTLEPPLSQFQNVLGADRDGFQAICARIRESEPIYARSFDTLFEGQWPILEEAIGDAIKSSDQAGPARRDLRDMVEEILLTVTASSVPKSGPSRNAATKFRDPHDEPGGRILKALGAINGRWGARRLGVAGSITEVWVEDHSPTVAQLEAALIEACAIKQSFLVITGGGDFRLDHKLGVIQPLLPA